MAVTPSTSEDAADRLAVREVLERYTYALDHRNEALMRSCFTPDAELSYFGGLRHYTGSEFADTFAASLEAFGFIDHSISSLRITDGRLVSSGGYAPVRDDGPQGKTGCAHPLGAGDRRARPGTVRMADREAPARAGAAVRVTDVGDRFPRCGRG